ncbi:hypothetical protein KDH_11740 [Dictyobacter sp. S3.2.2.5]|uniref:Uncharacterized protein n=1 Tax=Dictyobacter halimunensis TaxID=3026934 RepID=A0ABQ6FKW8_9CHLR|nr:hypothetical protein KDH_11740 [Dictyobacter sp. S3.2.2.5]
MQDANQHKRNEFQSACLSPNQEATREFSDLEELVIKNYPEAPDTTEIDVDNEEIDALLEAVERQKEAQQQPASLPERPIGYVSNARNATSRSDLFQFWAPAEEVSLGIGSIVRHTATQPQWVDTYGIIVDTTGNTLGLDDYAFHVYEQDALPPLDSITPAPSSRRPVVHYQAKVLASTQKAQRPVHSGPVYAVKADDFAAVHTKDLWLDPQYLLLGFYEDAAGNFGVFGEDRARVLVHSQEIFSGMDK